MKRIFCLLGTLLSTLISIYCLGATVPSGDIVSDFAASTSGKRITFSYTYVSRGDVTLKGSGTAIVQGEMFLVEGDGLKTICNGEDRWTVDEVAKEIIIEKVSTGGLDYLSNPASLLTRVDDVFVGRTVSEGTFSGRSVVSAKMIPEGKSMIGSMALHFVGKNPVGMTLDMKSGVVTEFTLADVKITQKGDEDIFHFDESTLSSDWVVTDLR